MAAGIRSMAGFWMGGISFHFAAAYSKTSTNTLTFHPASVLSSVNHGFNKASENTLTFHPASSFAANFGYSVSTENFLIFTPESSEIGDIAASTEVTIIFRVTTKTLGKEVVFADNFIGAYQQGQSAHLFVQAKERTGEPTVPTSQVTTRTYRLETSTLASNEVLTSVPRSRAIATVAGGPRLVKEHPAGRYFSLETWVIGGFVGEETAIFEVSAGGDPRGPVISGHDYSRPEARHVLVQVEGGLILKGRDPTTQP